MLIVSEIVSASKLDNAPLNPTVLAIGTVTDEGRARSNMGNAAAKVTMIPALRLFIIIERRTVPNITDNRAPKELPETGQDWFENPELQLKAAFFMQDEARNKVSDVLGKRQEEITKIFNKGTFLIIYNETGELPVVRFEDHTRYVPVFTDLFAARQFATDGQVTLGALPGDKIPSILPPETEGVIINPNTLCLRLNLCKE